MLFYVSLSVYYKVTCYILWYCHGVLGIEGPLVLNMGITLRTADTYLYAVHLWLSQWCYMPECMSINKVWNYWYNILFSLRTNLYFIYLLQSICSRTNWTSALAESEVFYHVPADQCSELKWQCNIVWKDDLSVWDKTVAVRLTCKC